LHPEFLIDKERVIDIDANGFYFKLDTLISKNKDDVVLSKQFHLHRFSPPNSFMQNSTSKPQVERWSETPISFPPAQPLVQPWWSTPAPKIEETPSRRYQLMLSRQARRIIISLVRL
jgi:hypothetical protein